MAYGKFVHGGTTFHGLEGSLYVEEDGNVCEPRDGMVVDKCIPCVFFLREDFNPYKALHVNIGIQIQGSFFLRT